MFELYMGRTVLVKQNLKRNVFILSLLSFFLLLISLSHCLYLLFLLPFLAPPLLSMSLCSCLCPHILLSRPLSLSYILSPPLYPTRSPSSFIPLSFPLSLSRSLSSVLSRSSSSLFLSSYTPLPPALLLPNHWYLDMFYIGQYVTG